MLKKLIVMFFVLGFASAANAQMTGNDLWALCTSKDKVPDLLCGTWTSGFRSGMHSAQRIAEIVKLPSVTCIPDGVTGGQVRLIIEKFMRDNPQELTSGADYIASRALLRAFPCAQSN